MEKYLLTVNGSSIDYFYLADSYPREGDFTYAKDEGTSAGGPPLNVGCVAASKGIRVKALDYLDEKDPTSDYLIEELSKRGIDVSNIQKGDADNAKVVLIISSDKRTNFVINPRRPYYSVDEKMQNLLNNASFVYSLMHIYNRSFENEDALRTARKNGARIIFDGTSKFEDDFEITLLMDLCDGLFINETDYSRLCARLGCDARKVLFDAGCSFICKTCGPSGAYCYTKDREYYSEALKLDTVVDSTGAGDSFAGMFLSALMMDMPYEKALRLACASGAYACTVPSGLGGCCSMEKLLEFCRDNNYSI